ncbi:MAG: adenosine kinase, partial [Verrucomicrobiota bacterium]
MRTMLGASALLTPDEISPSDFSKSRHVHIEGYLLFNPDLIKAVAQSAKEAGCTISLDLASFEVVNASKSQLSDLLSNEVDIVFANEDEAKAYFPDIEDYETIAKEFAKVCEIAVVKLGADGSLVAQGDTVHRIPGNKVERAIDTTGAGDLWASGFLAGWLTGKDLPTCGAFGSLMGAEIVQIMGASIPENRWSEILKQIQ